MLPPLVNTFSSENLEASAGKDNVGGVFPMQDVISVCEPHDKPLCQQIRRNLDEQRPQEGYYSAAAVTVRSPARPLGWKKCRLNESTEKADRSKIVPGPAGRLQKAVEAGMHIAAMDDVL